MVGKIQQLLATSLVIAQFSLHDFRAELSIVEIISYGAERDTDRVLQHKVEGFPELTGNHECSVSCVMNMRAAIILA